MTAVVAVDHTALPGGGELALHRLTRDSRHPIRVVLLEDGPLGDLLRGDDAPVTTPAQSGTLAALRLLRATTREPGVLLLANSLRAALLIALVRPRGSRFAMFVRDGVDDESLSAAKRILARWSLRRAELVLVNSRWTGDTVSAAVPGARIEVVFTSSGVSTTSPPSARAADGTLRVVFVGRLVEWKGPHLLIEAVARARELAPDLKIAVTVVGAALMGTDAYVDRLHAQVAAAGIEATFTGHVDVAGPLSRNDVLVHCSTRPEPFGQVIVQAAAAGLAVLAADSGGPREILADSPDARYPMGDVEALATRLVALGTDPRRLDDLARDVSGIADRYSDAAMAARFDDAIDRHLAGTTEE